MFFTPAIIILIPSMLLNTKVVPQACNHNIKTCVCVRVCVCVMCSCMRQCVRAYLLLQRRVQHGQRLADEQHHLLGRLGALHTEGHGLGHLAPPRAQLPQQPLQAPPVSGAGGPGGSLGWFGAIIFFANLPNFLVTLKLSISDNSIPKEKCTGWK